MSKWEVRSVTDLEAEGLLRVEDGNHGEYRPRRDEFVNEGVAFIRAADMAGGQIDFVGASKISPVARDRIRKGIGESGDVLLSHKGTVGRVAIAPPDSPPFVCSPQTTFWRSLDDRLLDRRFLRYFLESPGFVRQLDARKDETDMAAYVSLTEQRKLLVTVPPIVEQRAIAMVLDGLAAKEVSDVRIAALALDLIRAEVARANGGAAMPLSSLAKFVNGGAYTNGASGCGRMVIRIADLKSGPSASTVYSDRAAPAEKTAEPGDILMAWSGSLDVYVWSREAAIINQHIFKVLCDTYPPWLVHDRLAAAMPELQQIASDKATTMGHIKRHHLDDVKVPVPPLSVVKALDPDIRPIWERLILAKREVHVLSALRTELLQALFSGRLRVPEAEVLVSDVV